MITWHGQEVELVAADLDEWDVTVRLLDTGKIRVVNTRRLNATGGLRELVMTIRKVANATKQFEHANHD